MRHSIIAFVLCTAAFAQHVHTDRTDAKVLPLPKEKGVWHFAVYGDRTGGPREGVKVLAEAVGETNLLDPDLVMTVGDLVQGYNTTEPWMEEMREFTRIMNGLDMPWYPVAGNHDVYWRGPGRPKRGHEIDYETHFGPLWYWFRHKNAAFLVLYTDEGDPATGAKGYRDPRQTQFSKRQLAWVRRTLEETQDARHVFVFMHHPRWTEYYPLSNFGALREELERPGNVRAVFAGHIHQMRYDGKRGGIEYFALATTGGALGAVIPRAGALHHQNIVTVREDGISVATIPVGQVIDPRSITPELVRDVSKLSKLRHPEIIQPMIFGPGETKGDYVVRIVNPCSVPIEVTAQPDPLGQAIRFCPAHEHFRLEPGKSYGLVLRWELLAGIDAEVAVPELVLGVDLLANDRRIAIPPERIRFAARLIGVSDEDSTGVRPAVLTLDGEDDCVAVPSRTFDVPQGAFTVEGWLRADGFEKRAPFLAKTQSSEWGIFVNGGKPQFSVHLGGKYVNAEHGGAPLEPGRWHHLAGVYDGEEVRLYVDGALTGRAAGKGRRKTNDLPFYVGADPDGRGRPVDHFRGAIDEVRVSSTVRYSGDAFEPHRRHERDEDTVILLHLDRRIGPFTPGQDGGGAHAECLGGVRFEEGSP